MATDLTAFLFDLKPREAGPFKLDGADYVVKEATEAAHIAYKDATLRSMQMQETAGGGKQMRVTGGSEADSVLLALCLFRRHPGETKLPDTPVTVDFVKALPRRVSAKLYQTVRELSGMDEDQETEEFLVQRVAADTAKLETLRKKGVPPTAEPSSTLITS